MNPPPDRPNDYIERAVSPHPGPTAIESSESAGLSAPAGRHVYSADRMRAKAPSGATCERNMPPRWGFWACAVACDNHGAPDGALLRLVVGAQKLLDSMAVARLPLPSTARPP